MPRRKSFIIIGIVAAILIVAGSALIYSILSYKPMPSDMELLAKEAAGTELAFAFDQNEPAVADFIKACEMLTNYVFGKNEFEINTHTNAGLDEVNTLMQELRRAGVPEKWTESYVIYIRGLEYYKEYLEKTKEYIDTANSDPDKREALVDYMLELLFRACGAPTGSADALIISHQKDLREVRAFLNKYPNSGIVDRSGPGGLHVDYSVTNLSKLNATALDLEKDEKLTREYRHIALRVFSDHELKPNPQEMEFHCFDGKDTIIIRDNILNYIETETCLQN